MKNEKSEMICAYCECASLLYDADTVLCERLGVVSKGFHCKKFSYDPLKRVPPKTPQKPKLDYIDIDSED